MEYYITLPASNEKAIPAACVVRKIDEVKPTLRRLPTDRTRLQMRTIYVFRPKFIVFLFAHHKSSLSYLSTLLARSKSDSFFSNSLPYHPTGGSFVNSGPYIGLCPLGL